MNAARKTGTVPPNADTILQSPFVHELTQEEKILKSKKRKTKRLNINARNITDPAQKGEFRHLCFDGYIDYSNVLSK